MAEDKLESEMARPPFSARGQRRLSGGARPRWGEGTEGTEGEP